MTKREHQKKTHGASPHSVRVPKDEIEAVKWYRKAAEQNNPLAQNSLGSCYLNGTGVPKDETEAVKWYRKAAELDQSAGQFNFGLCLFQGIGIRKDKSEAVKWLHKAAEQGLDLAQTYLGFCYEDGSGVSKDAIEAVKWYRMAAEQNEVTAQFCLGQCFENGRGEKKIRQKLSNSIAWLRNKTLLQHKAFQDDTMKPELAYPKMKLRPSNGIAGQPNREMKTQNKNLSDLAINSTIQPDLREAIQDK